MSCKGAEWTLFITHAAPHLGYPDDTQPSAARYNAAR